MWDYNTSLTWTGGEAADLKCEGKRTLAITPPPEFGGKRDCWSPEDMLVGTVESCMLLTTLHFVGKLKIGLSAYESRAVGRMKRTSDGLRFQSMEVEIHAILDTPEDEEKMNKAVEQAEAFCPVSAAVSCPIQVNLTTEVKDFVPK